LRTSPLVLGASIRTLRPFVIRAHSAYIILEATP
jgi:hypothetical protein